MRNFIFLFLLFSAGCLLKSKREDSELPLVKPLITKNEDKGVKEILKLYGGQCEYGIGFSTSNDNGKIRYFWLKLSKSEIVEAYVNLPQFPASNVAYTFYKNLNEEKHMYDEIRSEIVFKNEPSSKLSYTFKQLEKVKIKLATFNKCAALIKEQKYDSLQLLLNPDTSVINYNKNEVINKIKEIDIMTGIIKETVFYGFEFHHTENGSEILHLTGLMIREKQDHAFSIDLDPNSHKIEIYTLGYDF